MEDKLKTLLSLAFPTMVPMAPKKGIDWMQEPYYSSGIAAESHPVASVVGPLKGANVLRQWLLKGIKPKPSPTSAISAISLADQEDDSPEFENQIAEWLSSDEENEQILLDHGIDPDRLYRMARRQIDTYENLNTPRLTYDGDRIWDAASEGDPTPWLERHEALLAANAYERGLKRRDRFRNPYDYSSGKFPPGERPQETRIPRDEQGRLMYRPESGTFNNPASVFGQREVDAFRTGVDTFYMEGPPTNIGEFTPWGNIEEPRQHPSLIEPSTGMQPSVDGFEYNTTGVDWIDDETPTLWERLEEYHRPKKKRDSLSYSNLNSFLTGVDEEASQLPKEDDIPEGFYEDLLQGKTPTIGYHRAYPQPEGYRSLLSELATGSKVYEDYTAEEKNSMKRELKERSRVSDYLTGSAYDGDMNDQPALTKWLEKNPLQMTVHTIKDTWGAGNPEDMVSMLYFGGEDRPDWAASHYNSESDDLSDGGLKEPQAFIRWDITPQGNVFKVKEAQIDMRWESGKANPPYMKESTRKLAQQTVIDWANSTSDILTIPSGEESFEKNHGKLSDFGDDAYFITLEGDDKFEGAMKESRSLKPDPRLTTGEELGGRRTWRATSPERLRELRAKYWGKKRHYDKYQKALIQTLKESGADIEDVTPEGSTRPWFRVKNPDEVRQRVEDKPFPMAMILKRIADRQVA